jgi:hypothetical protein
MSSHQAALPGLHIEILESDPAVIYAVDRDLRLTYCNAAWDRFAAGNGGEQIVRRLMVGRSLLDFIPDSLRRFYLEGFARVLETGSPWDHRYDCSDARVRREFHMRVLPLNGGAGLLVINSQIGEKPHRVPASGLPLSAYAGRGGIFTMCCHCRRTRRADNDRVWDWVPELVSHPPARVSHGLCGVCFEYHYGEPAGEDEACQSRRAHESTGCE